MPSQLYSVHKRGLKGKSTLRRQEEKRALQQFKQKPWLVTSEEKVRRQSMLLVSRLLVSFNKMGQYVSRLSQAQQHETDRQTDRDRENTEYHGRFIHLVYHCPS